jgi:hypothetical protein
MTPMIPPEEEAAAMPVGRQEPHRYHLRAMTPGLVIRPALRDGISYALSCELSRDSTDGRRTAHIHVRGRPTRRSAAIPVRARAALHCEIPQPPRRYADRASAGPNCS